jgi:CRISPR-associated endonuclease Csn1
MKNILGLDIGSNSIGWALVENNSIKGIGSRIIPMGAEVLNFEKGLAQTKNADRRTARSIRRMGKRYKARRNKLLYTLHELAMLPKQFQFSSAFDEPTKIQKINLLPIKEKTKQLTAKELLELKVKALTEKIELTELGKLIFTYNQLRGYSGGGNDDEDNDDKKDESKNDVEENDEVDEKKSEKFIDTIKVIKLPENYVVKVSTDDAKKKKVKHIVTIELLNENVEGKKIIECETFLENLKEGEEFELQLEVNRGRAKKNKGQIISKFLSLVKKTNWRKAMEELEEELDKLTEQKGSEAFLSEYFLAKINEDKNYRIRNKVVLRKRYQSEFDKVWETQVNYNPEFKAIIENKELLNKITDFIFPGNSDSQIKLHKAALGGGLNYLIRNQIIYYQRELQDQSKLIGLCRFEKPNPSINEKDPNYYELIKPFQVVAKSHPTFQEFKILEQINKLSINTRVEIGKKKNGEPKYAYSDVLLSANLKQFLYEELNKKKEVSGKGFYTKLEKEGTIVKNQSFLNGIHRDAKLKGNETLLFVKKQLGEWFEKLKLDDTQNLISFWEILYNAKGNEYDLNSERCRTIKDFIFKNFGEVENIDKLTIRFAKIKFARNYASLSLKAIENILPLMRAGKYFKSELPQSIHENIVKVINENQEDPFLKSAQEHLEKNQEQLLVNGGMMSSFATILVYGKHTAENFTGEEIKSYNDIKPIPIGQLRNPLAEQIINETLKMVKEIWKQQNEKPAEIRVELARELKNSLDERKKISEANEKNRKTNERVKQRLIELQKETSLGNIERYRLWSMQATEAFPTPLKLSEPTKAEIEKMRLWEEQKCISPYTGQPIPLSKLFDKGQYDIDHIIPKSRYFDDSLTNKVVCETSVNKDKGNRTANEYFEVGSTTEKILTKEQFTNLVNERFYGKKRKNLLATKIPQDPVTRQLKDTQYIATKVREELSKIVGSDNVKTTTGGVTDYLRNHWGLADKLKELTIERYEKVKPQLAEIEYEKYKKICLAKEKEYKENEMEFNDKLIEKPNFIKQFNEGFITKENNKLKIKGWSKRIDHRHHAMDALIIACTEQVHIQRLNNLNKELQDWLKTNKEKVMKDFEGSDEELVEAFVNLANEKREAILVELKNGFRNFEHPWETFSVDAKKALENIIVSHKPKEKLLIQKVEKGTDAGKKEMLRVRGKLHDATLYGLSNGKEAYRIKITKLAGKQFATEKTIEKIIDPLIKSAIKNHFEIKYKKNKAEAFSAEGINELNKDRKVPIYGFKIYYKEPFKKFNLTGFGNKKTSNELFNENLERMIDEDLKKEIISHVDRIGGFKEAFSKEGITVFNKHLEEIFVQNNSGKKFKKITAIKLKATETENEEEVDLSLLPLVRKSSYNSKLMVSTGSNYAFAILEKENKRHFDEISFFDATNIVNNAFKNGNKNIASIIQKHFEKENPESKLLFLLKQDEIIYLPPKDETVILDSSNPKYNEFWNDKLNRAKNIYTVVKFSKGNIYFLKHDIANPIINKIEFGTQDCYTQVNGVSIKDYCIKLNIDRLGNIIPAKTNNYTRPPTGINNLISEPGTAYQKNSLQTFSSFEEMNEDDAKARANISPKQHLINTTQRIKEMYADELKTPMDKTLKFKND